MSLAVNARAPLAERKDDLYETPPVAVKALLKVEEFRGNIWEPACGPGAIVDVLRKAGHTVIASDLVDYGCPLSFARRDFLMEQEAPFGCLSIITNPPYKLGHKFAAHALKLVPKVAMLLRLAFLESERRTDILEQGHLARVHVFRKRLPMMHRHGWTGNKTNSNVPFAWFVWDFAHSGPPELRRLSWGESA